VRFRADGSGRRKKLCCLDNIGTLAVSARRSVSVSCARRWKQERSPKRKSVLAVHSPLRAGVGVLIMLIWVLAGRCFGM
jgi:hypothetical protein